MTTPRTAECPACNGEHVQALAYWTTTDGGSWKYQPICETCGDTGEVETDEFNEFSEAAE